MLNNTVLTYPKDTISYSEIVKMKLNFQFPKAWILKQNKDKFIYIFDKKLFERFYKKEKGDKRRMIIYKNRW